VRAAKFLARFRSDLSVGVAGRYMYTNTPSDSNIYQPKSKERRNSKEDEAKGLVKMSASWCFESIHWILMAPEAT